MNKNNKILVGISVGDLNGIGIEIILKTFKDKRMFEFCTPILYGSYKTIQKQKENLKLNVSTHKIEDTSKSFPDKVNIFNVWNENITIESGQETKQGGKYAFLSLEAATNDLAKGKIDVLVTAPINKNTIQSKEFKFPGHTEYLESKLEGESLMILMTSNLKVALLTGHIPIKDVSAAITPELIKKKLDILHKTLIEDFSIRKPKIAVLSLNPHAGDNGLIGDEDDTIIKPTIQELQKTGKIIYGPYAADSFFGSGNYNDFDAVLAAYHDQGLTAFKTIAFGEGVNYTAGLNKIRTSPDHGTAFDIAGKGIANPSSFKEALFSAISIYKTRKMNKELVNNALSKQ